MDRRLVAGFPSLRGRHPRGTALQPCPREAAVLGEETASSRLLLEAEIDQFRFEEHREEQREPVIQVSDSDRIAAS